MTTKRVSSCRKRRWVFLISLTLLAWLTPCSGETRNRVDLRENWYLQSSCKVNVPAVVLSTLRFTSDHWYKATVPSTVLAAQVAVDDALRVSSVQRIGNLNRQVQQGIDL